MSWPCRSSPTGQHKFGAIKFTNIGHLTFVRACRFCTAIQSTVMQMIDGFPTPVSVICLAREQKLNQVNVIENPENPQPIPPINSNAL